MTLWRRFPNEKNRERGSRWIRNVRSRKKILWKDRFEASLSAERNDGAERDTFMQERRDKHRSKVLEKQWFLHTGAVVSLRGRNTSSTLGGMGEYVGTDGGRRWHWKGEDEIDLWLYILPLLYLCLRRTSSFEKIDKKERREIL